MSLRFNTATVIKSTRWLLLITFYYIMRPSRQQHKTVMDAIGRPIVCL